jgi:hypothetical protein
MTRSPRAVHVDLVDPVRRAPLAGIGLCAAGIVAALALGLAFRRQLAERDRLQAALEATAPPRPRAAPTPAALQGAADAEAVARELRVPWTRLLAELEDAAHESAASVALLELEPDPVRGRVRIVAEVRALPDALAFLRRLERCPALRHPMLESHERRKDDPDHPLRVQLSAEWAT